MLIAYLLLLSVHWCMCTCCAFIHTLPMDLFDWWSVHICFLLNPAYNSLRSFQLWTSAISKSSTARWRDFQFKAIVCLVSFLLFLLLPVLCCCSYGRWCCCCASRWQWAASGLKQYYCFITLAAGSSYCSFHILPIGNKPMGSLQSHDTWNSSSCCFCFFCSPCAGACGWCPCCCWFRCWQSYNTRVVVMLSRAISVVSKIDTLQTTQKWHSLVTINSWGNHIIDRPQSRIRNRKHKKTINNRNWCSLECLANWRDAWRQTHCKLIPALRSKILTWVKLADVSVLPFCM